MTADAFALGVDFGTSNTVAVMRWPDGRIKPLLFDGSPALLSGVFVGGSGELLAGRDAAHAARSRPECFEPNPKQHIDDGVLLLGTAEVPVAEVVAAVLGRVATEAYRAAAGPIAEVTITHPAAWGARRRQVLLDAAGKAGLGTPRLVPEPVAAASYFVSARHAVPPVGACIVVYDFGAGTFDASVVRRTPEGFSVLASEGLPDAGGLDIDAAIFAYLGAVYAGRDTATWRQLEQPESVAARKARRLLWEDVRTAKEMLSRSASTLIPIPLLDEDAPVGREQFELLARPILERTVAATRAALRSANLQPSGVSGLYLVGGSSRIPLVATLLHQKLGIAPIAIEQPELVVAEGSLYVPAQAPLLAAPVLDAPGLDVSVLDAPGLEASLFEVQPAVVAEPVTVAASAAVVEPVTVAASAAVVEPVAVVGRASVVEPVAVAGSAPVVADGPALPVAGGEPPAPVVAPEPPVVAPEPAQAPRDPAVAWRPLGAAVLLLLGAVVAIASASWETGQRELIIGTNAALSAVVTPLPIAMFLFALAGVGIPAARSRPGPVGWVLIHAGWAAGALTPLGLLLLNLSNNYYSWNDFADGYRYEVWVSFAAALALLVVCLWLLLGGLSRAGRAGRAGQSDRAKRIRGYLTAGAAGVLCGLWWFSGAAFYSHEACESFSGSRNDICEMGASISEVGGPQIPLAWLLFATGAFAVLGTVGLVGAILRMLFADRLRAARPVLVRIGVGVLVVSAVLMADLSFFTQHAVQDGNFYEGDPLALFTLWLANPSRSAYPIAIICFAVLFVVLTVVAISVQAAQRARRVPAGAAGAPQP